MSASVHADIENFGRFQHDKVWSGYTVHDSKVEVPKQMGKECSKMQENPMFMSRGFDSPSMPEDDSKDGTDDSVSTKNSSDTKECDIIPDSSRRGETFAVQSRATAQ